MVEWVTDIDADGVLEYHNIPEDGGIGGGSVEGYLKDGHTINVSSVEELQKAFDGLEGKFCPGTVTINIAEGTHNTTTALSLSKPNMIKKIVIKGGGKATTTINKTETPNAYEAVLTVGGQSYVELEGLTIEVASSNNSLCIQNNGSKLKIKDVTCKGSQQSSMSTYNNGETEIVSGFDIVNSSKANFGILTSKGSKLTLNNIDTLNMSNCTTGFLSEMGAMTLVFYTKISASGVTTKFSPALNNHSGTGWNLGTEG